MWSTGDEKTVLTEALAGVRAHLLHKLEGIDEESARRPMTPSLTSLLGIVKHVTGTELRICDTFGRPRPPFPPEVDGELWFGGDMWARPDETIADIAQQYRNACAAVDEVVRDTDLDTRGEWMGLRTTLRALLIGQIWETAQHAGHADVVRELIDGSLGGPRSAESAFKGKRARMLKIQGARMRGEVGPEVWDQLKKPRG
jgi:hypothetical protein